MEVGRRYTDGLRSCYICKTRQPKDNFYPEPSRAGGLANHCKPCSTSRHRQYTRTLDPRQRLGYKLKYTYNLTLQRYDELLAAQDGKCAACARVMQEPHVDHDHACCDRASSCGNCVRGLLCSQCNTAAGLLGDSPDTVMALAFYLTRGMDLLHV